MSQEERKRHNLQLQILGSQAYITYWNAMVVSGNYKSRKVQRGCGKNEDGSIKFRDLTEEELLQDAMSILHNHVRRLFARQLYAQGRRDVDEVGRLRMDGLELMDSVQDRVKDLWGRVTTANVDQLTDFKGYHEEFLRLFGFGLPGVDYDADVDPMVEL